MNVFEKLRRPTSIIEQDYDRLIDALCIPKVDRDLSDSCVRYFHRFSESEPLPLTEIPCKIQISHAHLPKFPGEIARYDLFAVLTILTTDFPGLVSDKNVISISQVSKGELEEAELTS